MRRTSALLGAAMLALGLLAAAPAAADIPLKLTHQGRILDDAGAAVTGSVDLAFTLYDAGSGGATVWSDQMTVDLGTGGFYSVELGDASSPINEAVLASSEVWLGLAVNGGAELTPRIQLTSVPYAVSANQALTVVPGAITTASIADGAVTSTQLASVPWQKLTNIPTGLDDGDADVVGGLSCATGDVAQYNGSAWACAAMSGYTDADAIAAVGAHYTDSDAIAAVGAHYTDADAMAAVGLEIVQHDDSRLVYLPAVTTDCTSGTGLWCTANNAWGRNRFSTHGRYTQCADNNDCSGNSITLNLTNNQHSSVLMSHLDWTNTRSFTVSVAYAGGPFRYYKTVNTHRPSASTNIYTSTVRTLVSNLPKNQNISVRITADRGRVHFDGFALSKMVMPEEGIQNKPTAQVFRYRGIDGAEYNSWTALPYTLFTAQKHETASRLKISWTDTYRTISPTSNGGACGWELRINGAACPSGPILHAQHNTGSAPSADTHMASAVVAVCDGVPAGPVTLQVYQRRRDGDEDCYRGHALSLASTGTANDYPATIIVEEMP